MSGLPSEEQNRAKMKEVRTKMKEELLGLSAEGKEALRKLVSCPIDALADLAGDLGAPVTEDMTVAFARTRMTSVQVHHFFSEEDALQDLDSPHISVSRDELGGQVRSQVSQTHRPDDPRRPFPHDVDAVEKPHAAYVYYHSRGTSDMQQAADIVGHAEALIPFPDQLLSGISNPCCEFVPSAWFPVLPQQHQKLYAVPFLQQAVEPKLHVRPGGIVTLLDEARPGKWLVVACFVRLSTTAFEAAKKLLQAPLSDSDHKTRREASLRNLALFEEHCKTKVQIPQPLVSLVKLPAKFDKSVPRREIEQFLLHWDAGLDEQGRKQLMHLAYLNKIEAVDYSPVDETSFYKFKVSMTKSSQLYPGTDLRLVDEPTLAPLSLNFPQSLNLMVLKQVDVRPADSLDSATAQETIENHWRDWVFSICLAAPYGFATDHLQTLRQIWIPKVTPPKQLVRPYFLQRSLSATEIEKAKEIEANFKAGVQLALDMLGRDKVAEMVKLLKLIDELSPQKPAVPWDDWHYEMAIARESEKNATLDPLFQAKHQQLAQLQKASGPQAEGEEEQKKKQLEQDAGVAAALQANTSPPPFKRKSAIAALKNIAVTVTGSLTDTSLSQQVSETAQLSTIDRERL